MAESNGSLKAANGFAHSNGKLNGQVNGKLNGKLKGQVNGQPVGQPILRRKPVKKQRNFFVWALSMIARLATWAAIFNILFRCPSSLEECDESSPLVCKSYFQLKNAVSPRVQPYYDQYASPYVELARPYYETVDSKVWQPTRAYAVQYGAPWVEKGRERARAQWEKNGHPQLVKLQEVLREKYDQTVAPYVSQACETAGPYYEIARTNAMQAYYEYVQPSYEFVHPYAVQGYDVASDFTSNTALPTAYWAWNKTYVFLDTTIWPQVRVAYLENVEPQLVRIGERLGRYKTRDHTKSLYENFTEGSPTDAHSSFSKPTPQSFSSSSTFSEQPIATETPEVDSFEPSAEEYVNPVQAPPKDKHETEKRRKAREMVAHDLELWQNKFAAQADEGATDMEERVNGIAKRMIARNAQKTGKSLFEKLEWTINEELEGLKAKISSLIEATGEDTEKTEKDIISAVRSSGLAIKQKAQAIRQWREKYDKDLQKTVVGAADVHFKILDETRNLALQQIGMRWAWTDGVTYKDWAKYHELKSTLSEWTEQLKQLIVTHPALLEAQDASAQVEDEGMEIASTAAKELARLKEVAHWKLVARDATDNFESEAMKLAAEAVGKVHAGKEAVIEEAQSEKEATFEKAENAASSVSSAAQDAVSSAASVSDNVKESVNHHASSASEVVDEKSTAASQSASSIMSAGTEKPLEKASELSSTASNTFESAVNEASSVAFEDGETLSSTVDTLPSSATDFASSAATSVSSLASEGKDALNDVVDEASAEANDAASAASNTVSSVLSEVSEDISEVVSSATDSRIPQDQISTSSQAAEASEALRDDAQSLVVDEADDVPVDEDEPVDLEADILTQREETPVDEMEHVKPAFLGAAAQKVPERKPILEDYVDTDVIESATNAAQEAYASAVSRASEQYSSAASIVSAQIYGTPKPVHEKLLSSVSDAYENALAAAKGKLNDAVEAASSGIQSTPTTTSTPTYVDWDRVESIASQRLNEGRLWAELQYQSAMIALGLATPTPASSMEKYYEQAKLNYFAGLGIAQDRYASFMSGASSALVSMTATPTPTDLVGSASSVASAARESVASAAQAASDAAGSAYNVAGDAYNAAGDTVASAAQAVDETISSVVDAASEQISSAGEAIAGSWDNVIAQISGQVYGEPTQIGWYDSIFDDATSKAAEATDVAASSASAASEAAILSAATASAEALKQYEAVSGLVSELVHGKEPTFSESVLSRLQAAYSTAAANMGSYASDASQAASSVGDKVGSAASQATDAVKGTAQDAKDEL